MTDALADELERLEQNAVCLFRAFVAGVAGRDVKDGRVSRNASEEWKAHAVETFETSLAAHRKAILSALREREPVAWRPIATAPKKPLNIVLLFDGRRVFPGYWGASTYDRRRREYNEGWVTGPSSPEHHPTHWMPLPAAPAPTLEQQEEQS